jgi:hypothetical protein
VAQQLGFKIAGRLDLDGVGHYLAMLDSGLSRWMDGCERWWLVSLE